MAARARRSVSSGQALRSGIANLLEESRRRFAREIGFRRTPPPPRLGQSAMIPNTTEMAKNAMLVCQ